MDEDNHFYIKYLGEQENYYSNIEDCRIYIHTEIPP